MKHPAAVTACNMELENLITDSNRSIATLAITTLLKVHCPSFITRMMLVEEKTCDKQALKDIHIKILFAWKHKLLEFTLRIKKKNFASFI